MQSLMQNHLTTSYPASSPSPCVCKQPLFKCAVFISNRRMYLKGIPQIREQLQSFLSTCMRFASRYAQDIHPSAKRCGSDSLINALIALYTDEIHYCLPKYVHFNASLSRPSPLTLTICSSPGTTSIALSSTSTPCLSSKTRPFVGRSALILIW